MKTLCLAAACLIATPAFADLAIRFDEGAPKDRFTFTNTGTCDLSASVITLDLSGSKAGLIFDVTGNGAGVEVFQPFEVVAGGANLTASPVIKDGDTIADLPLSSLAANSSFAFTIDLDDTVSSRQITVSNSEIEGARVTLTTQGETLSAIFGRDARADLKLNNCA